MRMTHREYRSIKKNHPRKEIPRLHGSGKNFFVVLKLMMEGMTNTDISIHLGISNGFVSQIRKGAIAAGFTDLQSATHGKGCWKGHGVENYIRTGPKSHKCLICQKEKSEERRKETGWPDNREMEHRKSIIMMVLDKGPANIPDLAGLLGRSRESIRRTIWRMIDEGFPIEKVSQGRNPHAGTFRLIQESHE